MWAGLASLVGCAALVAHSLSRAARAEGLLTIDTRRAALAGPAWTPPLWSEWIAARLGEFDDLGPLDRAELDELVARVAAMPPVQRVRSARVIWPDGLELEIELRRPVACVRTGDEFLSVSADGTLLPGYSSDPPTSDGGQLPVIGPNDGSFDQASPGGRLSEARHLAALAVAVSMLEHVEPEVRNRLGPVLIDASRAHLASVSEPGVRLLLPERRLALFGRAPSDHQPGELPVAHKWRHLARALEELDASPPCDWDLADLRWDRVRIRPRALEGDEGAQAVLGR
jgi:hypothetical protein